MESRTFTSREALQAATAELLKTTLSEPGVVMLSGGSTPLPVYEHIAAHPFKASAETTLFMSDERMVPESSSDHNGAQVMPMARALGIRQFIQVDTKNDIEVAAARFGEDLSSVADQHLPFTLGVLGLGTDGHTASLFNLKDAQLQDGRLAIPVHKTVGPDRVSVTEPLIRRFDRIVFLVAGPDKAEMVERLQSDPESIPAGLAVRNVANVELWYSVE